MNFYAPQTGVRIFAILSHYYSITRISNRTCSLLKRKRVAIIQLQFKHIEMAVKRKSGRSEVTIRLGRHMTFISVSWLSLSLSLRLNPLLLPNQQIIQTSKLFYRARSSGGQSIDMKRKTRTIVCVCGKIGSSVVCSLTLLHLSRSMKYLIV